MRALMAALVLMLASCAAPDPRTAYPGSCDPAGDCHNVRLEPW